MDRFSHQGKPSLADRRAREGRRERSGIRRQTARHNGSGIYQAVGGSTWLGTPRRVSAWPPSLCAFIISQRVTTGEQRRLNHVLAASFPNQEPAICRSDAFQIGGSYGALSQPASTCCFSLGALRQQAPLRPSSLRRSSAGVEAYLARPLQSVVRSGKQRWGRSHERRRRPRARKGGSLRRC